jgi:magnesium-transporting ATPase (P-type)
MIFGGTAATYNPGKAVIVATGMQTQMRRIAELLKKAPAEINRCKRTAPASDVSLNADEWLHCAAVGSSVL